MKYGFLMVVLWVGLLRGADNAGATYPFSLPVLPYAYQALEPYIDAKTMELHHGKHHQAYVDKLNKALLEEPSLQKKTLEQLLSSLDAVPEKIREAVRNNGGGHYNHSLFWDCMAPSGAALWNDKGAFEQAIIKKYGSKDAFEKAFTAIAQTVFGSGWTWLCLNAEKQLVIIKTANQDSPFSQGLAPLLCFDEWEHAYYLKYLNKRDDYIAAWWHIVNWPYVAQRYQKFLA